MCLAASPAYAQRCEIVYEEITRLNPPDFGHYSIWDEVYGDKGMDQISDFVILTDGSVVMGGAYTSDEEDNTYKPLLVHITPQGKILWEVREKSDFFKTVDHIVETEDGYAVLGEIEDPKRGDGIYLAHYTKDGQKKNQKTFFEPGGNLDGKALVKLPGGAGYMIAAQYNPENLSLQYGIIYKVTKSGARLMRRAYTPGMQTVFNNFQDMGDGTYMLSGQLRLEDGRRAGWLVKLDQEAAIMWQKTYARGSFSALRSVAPFEKGGYLLGGEARPSGGGRSAGWALKIDDTGNVEWQRYYVGKHAYVVRDVLAYEDGRSVALLDGMPQKLEDRAHIRLLDYTPRGYLMSVEDYSKSQGAHAFTLKRGPKGERVFAGYAQTRLSAAMTPEEVPVSAFDAWLVAAVALEPYKDPCLPREFFME